VFDDLVGLAGLRPQARVLEIGCGTGQATRPLAERGFEITCVELGMELAAFARRKLRAFPNVTVVNDDFETWLPPDERFDGVVAFTAFHWIDPSVRFEKSARALRENGALVVVETEHVCPEGGDPFWAAVQEDYDAVAPDPNYARPPHPEEVGDVSAEIESSGRFEIVGVRRHTWDVVYTADDYIAVLETYSGHRALDDESRRALFARIRRRIQARANQRSARRTWRR
jgi:SAM-dependent methyltransferase